MSNNHLIIGLGGTGGSIIRSFRKTVYQAYGTDVVPSVNIRYLYIDSNDNDLNPDSQSWTILGHSVGLSENSQLPISGLNLKNVIENVNEHGNIKSWIGDRRDWADILNSVDASKVVGSQKRRLGRFLFANKIPLFSEKLTGFVSNMETDNSKTRTSRIGATFHVCCGLAGGTGSGIVVDVISQIRAAYPGKHYRIIVYAQLPEEKPGDRERGNYHANGYAALMELNALKIDSWQPHDLRYNDGRRLNVQDPFNCCYLFSDQNESDVAVSVNDLPDIVASFLFQKIVLVPNVNWGDEGDKIERIETFENTPAGITPELSPRSEPRRTRSFLSFGIKQIAYPEVEISEFLTYSFAQQAALHLLYNNWSDRNGYEEDEVKFDCNEFVTKPEQQERWYFDDQHLMLSRGILRSEINNKTWKPIAEFWTTLIPNYVLHVLDQYKDAGNKMMPELIKLCVTAFDEQYRGSGVRSFYKIKLGDNNRPGDIRDQVHELRQRVESDLFEDWRNGTRSMHDIERIVISLISALQTKLLNIDLNISKLSENGERYTLNETRYRDNNRAWGQLGPLSFAIGKHKKILNAQAGVLAAKYTMLTELEGYRYARKLVEALLPELNSLSSSIGDCKATIIEAVAAFKVEIASRLADDGKSDLGRQMVRHYDPKAVRDFVRDLCRDKDQQFKQSGEVRLRLVELLRGRLTFATFATTVPGVAFQNALSESCAHSAAAAHANVIQSDKNRTGVLRVSLIELLQRDFAGKDTALRQYARDIMKMAMNYLRMDDEEKNKGVSGDPSRNNEKMGICETTNIIIAPETPKAADFRDAFCAALQESRSHGKSIIVTNRSRPQEITILTLTSVFPARFAQLVAFLRTKYYERIAAGGKRAFLELHSEGEGPDVAAGQEMFDLYPETYRLQDILPWIMLAQNLGLIVSGEDKTGRDMLFFSTKDKDGLPDNRPLGPNLASVIEKVDPKDLEDLKHIIRGRLDGEYLHIAKRTEIEAAIVARVRTTAETTGANSQLYKREKEALSSIRKILGIEA